MESSPILISPIVVCVIGGLIAYVLNRRLRVLTGLVALAASVAALVRVIQIFVAVRWDLAGKPLHYLVDYYNFSIGTRLSLNLALRVWHFGALMALGVGFFGALVMLYSLYYMRRHDEPGKFYAFSLWALAGAFVVVMSDNWLFFVVGWEIVTAMLFLLVNLGGPEARNGAAKTFVLLGFADASILLGIVLLVALLPTAGQQVNSVSGLRGIPFQGGLAYAVYLLFLAGALAKGGSMPLNTWVPAAAEHAPIPVLALLPASLDKLLGIYLLARISLQMFVLNDVMSLVLLLVGAVTILGAVFMAMVQHDLRRLLGYHAVSQVGYMVLGMGTGAVVGIVGGLFHMLNNAIYKSALFLGAGSVEDATGERELDRLGGLAKTLPVTFAAMLVAALSISGVPPLNGFVSKWMIYQGAMVSGTSIAPLLLAAAVFGSALTLASFIKVINSVFFGTRPEGMQVRPRGAGVVLMWVPMLVLALLCILFGVWASLPVVKLLGPALAELQGLPSAEQLTWLGSGRTAWPGLWSPGWATILIVVGLALGLVFYLVGRGFKTRIVPAYMGGEIVRDDRIRYRATNFYRTIQELPMIGALLRDAGSGAYDVYHVGQKYGQSVVDWLRRCHNGMLPLYVTWSIAGLVIILLYLG